ncbi:unnamed protein product [Parnassius apollo]|uniref:(apollo) hypothetical protein n=1 Tax=Parnassius apollo TaxID=110799 RepID=A0A8S3Y847_PARAO|nr:unnamed protein product [Parnassius apollo]
MFNVSRNCDCCKNRHLNYQEFDNSKGSHYWFWTKSKKKYIKKGQEKITMQSLKQKVLAYPKNIMEHFEKLLEPYMCHCANIVAQNKGIKNLKSNLKSGEFIVHCDFSEKYNTKYASEIQSFHFGSSRQQVTLHTSVIYYVKNEEISTKSFCTLSECLRHDAVAIWEHLIPILNFIEKEVSEMKFLNFISDSPSAQYRNRKMFYVMAKLHWNYPNLRRVVWNHSKKGHGKGAPDGVRGVLKRTADQIVAQGNDIPNIEALISHLKIKCPGVSIEEVVESGVLEKELLIPSDLKEFRGTMAVHQAIWSCNNPEVLAMRRLSCEWEYALKNQCNVHMDTILVSITLGIQL